MSLRDWLYPKHCPICLEALPAGEELICEPCKKKIMYTGDHTCYRCGKPLRDRDAEYCGICKKTPPPFLEGIAWASYSSKYIRRLMAQVKYYENRQLLDYPCLDFARQVRPRVESWGAECLIPVPVHITRRRIRGYNQAEEIAERLGKELGLPVDRDYLVRSEKTVAQKELSREDRARNLMGAFGISGEFGRYRKVILVDDILTTGSTARACAFALMRGGCEEVRCLFLSTTPERGWQRDGKDGLAEERPARSVEKR